MLYVCIRLPIKAQIVSNIALEVGFSDVLGLYNIPYYLLIRYTMNL